MRLMELICRPNPRIVRLAIVAAGVLVGPGAARAHNTVGEIGNHHATETRNWLPLVLVLVVIAIIISALAAWRLRRWSRRRREPEVFVPPPATLSPADNESDGPDSSPTS